MLYISVMILLYLLLMLIACIVGLFLIHLAYARAILRRRTGISRASYRQFVRQWASGRYVSLVLVKIPLATAVALTALSVCTGVVRGLTATQHVRSKMNEATRLVVRTGGSCHRHREREQLLFETREPQVIRGFAEQITLRFNTGLTLKSCACCGQATFDLCRGDALHYSFSLHHGRSIRIKGSSRGDQELSVLSRRDLASWLEEHGVSATLLGFESQDGTTRQASREEDLSLEEAAVPAQQTLE